MIKFHLVEFGGEWQNGVEKSKNYVGNYGFDVGYAHLVGLYR